MAGLVPAISFMGARCDDDAAVVIARESGNPVITEASVTTGWPAFAFAGHDDEELESALAYSAASFPCETFRVSSRRRSHHAYGFGASSSGSTPPSAAAACIGQFGSHIISRASAIRSQRPSA